ncbi:RagB/SusD family nutrient uptake outer membrane protein [Bacteroidota bacterium]
MKKALLGFLIPVFLIFSPGCEENPLRLLPPDGLVKDEYWKNKEDVEAVLMGAYQEFANMDDLLFYYGEIRGDMLQADYNLQDELVSIINGNIYPWNSYASWQSFYQIINYCNSVLKFSPQVKSNDPTFTTYNYNSYNAEAVFLRSLAYFYMVRIFKDVPFVLYPYDTDNQDFFPKKTESEIIIDSLEVHLNGILNKIPEEYKRIDITRGRATRGAVYALLADIALWKFDYENCIRYVEKIEESELYDLLPGPEWFTIFSEGNTLEGIFEIQFDTKFGEYNNMASITHQSSHRVLASEYANEILGRVTAKEMLRSEGSISEEYGTIWKYVGQQADGRTSRPGSELQSCNWIVYRRADLMLMKAEALSQVGRYNEALRIVNEIRIRAFVEPYNSWQNSPTAFEDLILEERAKELAYEGKRWFDLLRMGRRNNYERKEKLIEVIIKNVPSTQKRVLAAKLNDPYGWYLPIEETEVENNPNLEQNPYYKIYERED